VDPQELEAWYDTWTSFTWRGRVFVGIRAGDGRIEGRLCNGSLSWARANGLDVYGPDDVYGVFPMTEVSGLEGAATNLLDEWRAYQLGPSTATKAQSVFGRWLLAGLTTLPGDPGSEAELTALDALAAEFRMESDWLSALWSVVEDLIRDSFASAADEGVLTFSRELGLPLADRSSITPYDIASAVMVALGHPEMQMPDIPGPEFVRLCLHVAGKIARFRTPGRIELVIARTEEGMAGAGRPLA
jgi:hypothetical protein